MLSFAFFLYTFLLCTNQVSAAMAPTVCNGGSSCDNGGICTNNRRWAISRKSGQFFQPLFIDYVKDGGGGGGGKEEKLPFSFVVCMLALKQQQLYY